MKINKNLMTNYFQEYRYKKYAGNYLKLKLSNDKDYKEYLLNDISVEEYGEKFQSINNQQYKIKFWVHHIKKIDDKEKYELKCVEFQPNNKKKSYNYNMYDCIVWLEDNIIIQDNDLPF